MALVILTVGLILPGCNKQPKMSDYFDTNVTYVTYMISPDSLDGIQQEGPYTMPLSAFTDRSGKKVPIEKYLSITFTLSKTAVNLHIYSLNFIVLSNTYGGLAIRVNSESGEMMMGITGHKQKCRKQFYPGITYIDGQTNVITLSFLAYSTSPDSRDVDIAYSLFGFSIDGNIVNGN